MNKTNRQIDNFMNNTAYKDGMASGLKDWSVTGAPHRTTECPLNREKDRINWWLGRAHGFIEAEKLIEERSK